MKTRLSHSFRLSPAKAKRLQEELRGLLEVEDALDLNKIDLVAAADVSYARGDERTFASVVVCSYPEMELVETRSGSAPVTFPYVPGLLAFREAPALLSVFRRLEHVPDAILFDGHGIAHPRGFGIASHMGVLLGVPSVGVAKTVLVGEYRLPGRGKGSRTRLVHERETVGFALRTRENVKPVFVSPGHLVDLESSVRLALSCCRGYRLPEPLREAHRLSNAARRNASRRQHRQRVPTAV